MMEGIGFFRKSRDDMVGIHLGEESRLLLSSLLV
jgi:hypothetical protein